MLRTEEEQETRWIEHFKDVMNQPEPEIQLELD